MKLYCEKCGGKFTPAEIKQLLRDAEYSEPMYICQECAECLGNCEEGEIDFYSDADNGL